MSKAREYLEKLDAEFEGTWEHAALQLQFDLAQLVIRGLKERGWTASDLAGELRWNEDEIDRVLHGVDALNLEEIAQLLHALGVQGKLSAAQDAAARGTEQ